MNLHHQRPLRIALLAALAMWASFAFWLFSFSFSSSFFSYSLPSRLPTFFAAFFAALVMPVSGFVQWRRVRHGRTSALRAWFVHALTGGLSLLPLALIAGLLARAPQPWRLSGDDAMGVGIDFLMLVGLGLVSLAVLAVALVAQRHRR